MVINTKVCLSISNQSQSKNTSVLQIYINSISNASKKQTRSSYQIASHTEHFLTKKTHWHRFPGIKVSLASNIPE